MAKILKILAKTIGSILEWLLILIIALAFAIRTSSFQTYLAEVATDYLSRELDTELHIGKVDIYFFDKLSLDDVFVRDQNGDTLASLTSIDVVLESLNLSKNKIILKNITLNQGRVGISRDSIKGDYNYWFITDYFDSGKKKTKKKPTDLTIQSLDLDQVDVTYDDYRKSYSDYGMDFDHLNLKNVELHAHSFKSDGSTFAFNLEKLSAKEQCGFDLRRLKAKCVIGNKGILLSDVRINTSRSRIYAHEFNLRMTGLKDINSFVDSVVFDAEIDSSAVNMRDVSYFAPALKGMYQKVYLRAGLSQKVKNLKITDIDLRTGKRTIVRGDLNLPDFRRLESSFLNEKIEYAFVDLDDVTSFRLPDKATKQFLTFDPMVERLGYFEVKKLDIVGYPSQFVLSSRHLSTDLGTVHLDNGLLFTALNEGGYEFERSANSTYDVAIDSFNLGKFIANPMFGDVRGTLFLGGVVGQSDVIRLHKLDGEIHRFAFNNYSYSNISVTEGSYKDRIFDARIDVDDPHLKLLYDGYVDMSKGQKFDFVVDVKEADLGKLNFTSNLSTRLVTNFKIDLTGTDFSNYDGKIILDKLSYQEDSNAINIPSLDFTLNRGASNDQFDINSNVADIHLEGKVDPLTIVQSINNMLCTPLSAYFQFDAFPRKQKDDDYFDLKLDVKEADEVLRIFAPKLKVGNGTQLLVHYNALNGEESVSLRTGTGEIVYDSIHARGVDLEQSIIAGNIQTNLKIYRFALSDSLFVNDVDLDVKGSDNEFASLLKWNESGADPARFVWTTKLGENNRVAIRLRPSFFSVKHQLWEIQNSAKMLYQENRLEIDHLVIERESQFIAINGILSDNKEDEVSVNLRDIHLEEFSSFINAKTEIAGNLNGDVRISTPFTAFKADGDLKIRDLVVEKQQIGDVTVGGLWDDVESRVALSGSLRYALINEDAFDFSGYYYPYKEENNVDLDLDFNNLDVQFANAFVDPSVLSEIKGKLKGKIEISGNISEPMIDGKLKLSDGNVKVGMLGVSYKMAGQILFDGESSGFYINNMPVLDEEGNKAFLTAAISHEQFSNWNTDININMEDDYSRRDTRGVPMPVDRFLVMNTTYKEGDVYYGRAYVTGTANIFLTDEDVAITVDVKTRRDTKVDLPMYGNSELEEGKFILVHDPKESLDSSGVNPKLDLTGLDLNLNIDVTPDAEVKLIFNDKTEDMIVAHGAGTLAITLDNLNNLSMTGEYKIVGKDNNYYNFVMGPIKQLFKIKEGGTIVWVEDPYNAKLNLEAYNPVKANINEIAPDLASGNASNGNKEVQCIMRITETLYEPKIDLDIDAPAATETERAILNEVRGKPEELQKQFFSLLLFKKFVPLAGHATGGAGGLADVLMQQMNGILSGLTDDVKLNLAYDGDNLTGQQSYKLGVSRQFGRVVLKGSFGVANTTEASGGSQSNLIGDMSLEYLINEDGTFRVNLFNESNDNSVIQDKTQGLFTQGVGLSYQEEFNSARDFKMLQIILDRFRKEKRVKIKKHRREVSVDEPLEDIPPVEEKKENNNEPANTPVINTGDTFIIVEEED